MSSQASPTLSLKGIGASPGVAVGHAYILDRKRVRTPKLRLAEAEVDPERMRMRSALELSDQQLSDLKEQISRTEGPEHALILEAHRLMLHDPMFVDEVNRLIVEDRINAEWAVRRVARKLKHLFDNIPDEYFRERRSDVEYVADRVVRNLLGQVVDEEVALPEHAVVVAHDLSPADAAMLVRGGQVAGFVTDLGGHTSHTAIVARARSVPAVLGAGRASEQISPGDLVALDGARGILLVNPSEEQLALFKETMRRYQEGEARALAAKDLPAQSTDGYRIRLVGNIEFPEELPSLLAHGAEGIGLYRTEFLFLERADAPSLEGLLPVRKRPADLTVQDIQEALARHGGNKTRTAAELGVAPKVWAREDVPFVGQVPPELKDTAWDVLFDPSVPARFLRPVDVVGEPALFQGLGEVTVEFEHGGRVVLSAQAPRGQVQVGQPIGDFVLGRPDAGTFRYRLTYDSGAGTVTSDWRVGQGALLRLRSV